MAEQDGIAAARINDVVSELRMQRLLVGEDGEAELTPAGREHSRRLIAARRELLGKALADEDAERNPELSALLHRLARELCGEPPGARAPVGAL